MALEQERPVGIRGLNLATDPAQQEVGSLRAADGVRYVEAGAAHTRLGSKPAAIGWDETGDYQDQFVASGRVRGIVPFYDTRNYTTGYAPRKLNYVYKANGKLYFNNNCSGDGTGLVTGAGDFQDVDTKAKLVVYGDRVYVIDRKGRPKVLRASTTQTEGTRKKYSVGDVGIVWPPSGVSDPADPNYKPTVTGVPWTDPKRYYLPPGLYRFKIVCVNAFNDQSMPSMEGVKVIEASGLAPPTDQLFKHLTVSWTGVPLPAETTEVHVYASVRLWSEGVTGEPTDFYMFRSMAPNVTTTNYDGTDHEKLSNGPPIRKEGYAPPPSNDMILIGDVAYYAASAGTVTRTVFYSDVENNRPVWPTPEHYQRTWNRIRTDVVDDSYLFMSVPGEPQYARRFIRIGNGNESIVGLAGLGLNCVVFTNKGIYIYDPQEDALKATMSQVGCASRESIVHTEFGVVFLGTDGVPRLFNGATTTIIGAELAPFFDREDFESPDYEQFDKRYSGEISGTTGDGKLYISVPFSPGGTNWKPDQGSDTIGNRYLIHADSVGGGLRWSMDRRGWDELVWLGRENRLVGIDRNGKFFFIEEGLVDETLDGPRPIPFSLRTRWVSAGGVQAQFLHVRMDIDTAEQPVGVEFAVDEYPGLNYLTSFSTTRRQEVELPLPAKFKGRFLDIRLFGECTQRIGLFGLLVEVNPRGVMS